MKSLHLIYVPGLGDQNVSSQQWAVNTWHRYGVTAELVQMNWASGDWEPKLERILTSIDAAVHDGKAVGLVGASAGASAVINAYAARRESVVGVVLIAGKVNRPETVGHGYKSKNPAFWTSINQCQLSLAKLDDSDRKRILSRRGLLDEVVLPADNIIPKAHNHRVPSIGHVITISTQLLFGAPSFIRFLRKQAALITA